MCSYSSVYRVYLNFTFVRAEKIALKMFCVDAALGLCAGHFRAVRFSYSIVLTYFASHLYPALSCGISLDRFSRLVLRPRRLSITLYSTQFHSTPYVALSSLCVSSPLRGSILLEENELKPLNLGYEQLSTSKFANYFLFITSNDLLNLSERKPRLWIFKTHTYLTWRAHTKASKLQNTFFS